MTILEDVRPTARKRHQCDICLGWISEGDTYNRQRGIWEGEAYTHKSHGLCLAAHLKAMRDNDYRADWGEGTDWGEDVRPLVEAFFANVIAATQGRIAGRENHDG